MGGENDCQNGVEEIVEQNIQLYDIFQATFSVLVRNIEGTRGVMETALSFGYDNQSF